MLFIVDSAKEMCLLCLHVVTASATALNKVGGPIIYIFQCIHMNATVLRLLHPTASMGS